VAEIIILKPGETPPDDCDHLLVSRDLKGQYAVGSTIARKKGATFYVPSGPGDDRAIATAAACEIADRQGAPTV
jgi:hypothetical protein